MTIDEMLAAYADGALDPEERAQVERYLAAEPTADDEVEALQRVLGQVRAAEPRPAHEPDWAAMSRAIGAGIDAPVVPLHRRIVRPRYLAPLVAVAAAVVLFVTWPRATTTGTSATGTAPGADPIAAAEPATEPVRAPELLDLEADELATLDRALEGEVWDETDDGAPPVLGRDLAHEWAALGREPLPDASGLGPLDEPDYTDFVDSLSPEELAELDAYLAGEAG